MGAENLVLPPGFNPQNIKHRKEGKRRRVIVGG
jgi:hypothetical protein